MKNALKYQGFGGRRKTLTINGPSEDKAGNVSVIQGDPKLNSFDSNQTEIIRKYLDACGYSNENDFNASNTTNIGVLFKGKADIETTNLKKGLREQKIKDLIAMIIMVNNQFKPNINVPEDNPISVKINSFIALDKEQRAKNIEVLRMYGILTYRELIDHLFDLKGDEEDIQKVSQKLGKNPDDLVNDMSAMNQDQDNEQSQGGKQ